MFAPASLCLTQTLSALRPGAQDSQEEETEGEEDEEEEEEDSDGAPGGLPGAGGDADAFMNADSESDEEVGDGAGAMLDGEEPMTLEEALSMQEDGSDEDGASDEEEEEEEDEEAEPAANQLSKRKQKKLSAQFGIDLAKYRENPFASADDFQSLLDGGGGGGKKQRAWEQGSTRAKRRQANPNKGRGNAGKRRKTR